MQETTTVEQFALKEGGRGEMDENEGEGKEAVKMARSLKVVSVRDDTSKAFHSLGPGKKLWPRLCPFDARHIHNECSQTSTS